MNKAIRIIVLTGFIFFLASHYLVMSIDKEYFPVFAYLYPFVAKVWFETGRLFMSINLNIDLENLFKIIKYLVLLAIVIAVFAFKYQSLYRITLWIGTILCAGYLLALFFLGLVTIYPIYTVCSAFALAIFLSLIKNKPL